MLYLRCLCRVTYSGCRRVLSTTSSCSRPRARVLDSPGNLQVKRAVVDGRDYEEVEVERSEVDPRQKWGYLFDKKEEEVVREQVYETHYGSIRLDTDNVAKFHGQFDVDQEDETILVDKMQPEKVHGKESEGNDSLNYFDELAYGDSYWNFKPQSEKPDKPIPAPKDSDLNYFDELTFGESYRNSVITSEVKKLPEPAPTPAPKDSDMNYFDEVTFGDSYRNSAAISRVKRASEPAPTPANINTNAQHLNGSLSQIPNMSEEREKVTGRELTRLQEKVQNRVTPNLEKPETAFDYVMKLRQEEKRKNQSTVEPISGAPQTFSHKVDSEGFRVLDEQTTNWYKVPREKLLLTLTESILFDNYDILALYKPYGVAMHDASNLSPYKITDFLPELAQKCHAEQLYTVHRLDKETTGVLLLAKTQKMADILNSMFQKNSIQKIYWGITKSVPNPLEGIIDIPIVEGIVNRATRMVLRPDYQESKLKFKSNLAGSHSARTYYKTLTSQDSGALLELKPETGVKHQIRVHLAFGLNCPILGDHKYSNLTKIAPQKLPGDMLNRLGMRQSKARTVPMHLHSKTIIIPEIADGRDVWVSAKLPRFFVTNMHRLKLTPKD